MTQLANDNTPFKPSLRDGGRGLVQCVHDGANNASLYGSLNGTTFGLIHTFTSSEIKEVALAPDMLIAADTTATVTVAGATDVNAATKVYINETR